MNATAGQYFFLMLEVIRVSSIQVDLAKPDEDKTVITTLFPPNGIVAGDIITVSHCWTFRSRLRALRKSHSLDPNLTWVQKLFWLFGYKIPVEVTQLFVVTE